MFADLECSGRLKFCFVVNFEQILFISVSFTTLQRRRGHVPPKVLGYQLTLFGPRGADYAHHITTEFKDILSLRYS